MEYKFVCEWFEVQFSGDPGFVESQLSKYEPMILEVLKRIEREIRADDGSDGPAPVAERPSPKRDRPRQDDSRQNDRGRDSGSRETVPGPRTASRNDVAAKESAPAPKKSAPAKGKASAAPKAAVPEQETPPAEPVAKTEFASRRRAPRIQVGQLSKMIDLKKPRTHHDRIMVFGYYMEHEGGGSDFTITEVKKCYTSASQDQGVNIEQVINHASRSGFIVANEQGRTPRFKLSPKGRRYVEDGLKLS